MMGVWVEQEIWVCNRDVNRSRGHGYVMGM